LPHTRIVIPVALLVATGLAFGTSASATPWLPSAPAPLAVTSTSPLLPITIPPTTTPPIAEPQPALSAVSIRLDAWANGFTRPVLITSRPGDDRVYVVEQKGRIISLQPDGSGRTTVLDMSDRVSSTGNERGLLGLAFYPDDPSRMFVSYTDTSGNSRVAEYSFPIEATAAAPDAVQLLLHLTQPYSNHNGGNIAFGPDGYLYIGFGDGGSAGDPRRNGQNLKTWLGKMLRIDVSEPTGYTIPPTNPFADGRGGAKKEIWAYGLRNPWRFSFDGDLLYIGDVGQYRVEEVDILNATTSAGANFGWRTMEGNLCYPSGKACSNLARGFVGPKFHYSHGKSGRCSVTGGYVYRGEEYPELQGIYFLGDYCTGEIIGLRVVSDKVVERRMLLNSSARISSFGAGSDGQIYVADISRGTVLRLVPGS
jgi:glucose/arabinose dehydrogenase